MSPSPTSPPSNTTPSPTDIQPPSLPPVGRCPIPHNQNNQLGCSSNTVDQSPAPVPSEIYPDSTKAPGQRTDLKTVGVKSTIPKADGDRWMYPSEQRFYNALLKKGWNPDENLVPSVVSIHNTVNERCWREILAYESFHPECQEKRKLVNFRGRPNEYTPKARLAHHLTGRVLPFDRHDWVVDRCGQHITYIIDFYEGKPILPPVTSPLPPVSPSQTHPQSSSSSLPSASCPHDTSTTNHPSSSTSSPSSEDTKSCPASQTQFPAASIYLDVRPQLTWTGLYDRLRFQYSFYFHQNVNQNHNSNSPQNQNQNPQKGNQNPQK